MTKKIEIDIRSNVPELSYGTGQGKSVDIRSARLNHIITADDKVILTEPSSQSHSQYPYNKVDQSQSGHIKEVDDTPGAERLMEMHKSGTFYEILPDGTKIAKIFGDDFYIVLVDHTLVVGGNLNITVQGDANFLVKGNMKTKVGGDYELQVHGNMTTRVQGSELHYTKGSVDNQSNSNISMRSQGNFVVDSTGHLNLQSRSKVTLRSQGPGQFYSTGNLDLDGSKVYLKTHNTDPGKLNIKSKDPTGGLSIPDTVISPNRETLMKLRTDNKLILGLDDDIKSYSKDRSKII